MLARRPIVFGARLHERSIKCSLLFIFLIIFFVSFVFAVIFAIFLKIYSFFSLDGFYSCRSLFIFSFGGLVFARANNFWGKLAYGSSSSSSGTDNDRDCGHTHTFQLHHILQVVLEWLAIVCLCRIYFNSSEKWPYSHIRLRVEFIIISGKILWTLQF